MADTDKLHSAINSLQENADRIASIGKLSEDLLKSQVQLSTGIQQMTDGLGQMHSNQLEITREMESIKKMELSIGNNIATMNKNISQIDANMKTRLDELENRLTVTDANIVSAVKWNRGLIVMCSIVVITVIVILHFL